MTAKKAEQSGGDEARAKGFLNIPDSEAFLGVKTTTLYRLVEKGELTKFKIRGRTVFSRTELERVAKASETTRRPLP